MIRRHKIVAEKAHKLNERVLQKEQANEKLEGKIVGLILLNE